ncbi:MAG: hypothetical protein WBY94_01390 [Polyangiaceae bacterium]
MTALPGDLSGVRDALNGIRNEVRVALGDLHRGVPEHHAHVLQAPALTPPP